MKIITTTVNRLTPPQLAAWHEWQRENPALDSPYFHPEFVRLAAEVRPMVEIGLMEVDGELAGIFPFKRRGRTGIPVAAPLNDFQAVIARPGFTWDAEELVRGCGLTAWRFDHLLAQQSSFAKFHEHVAPSPYVDLSRGFEAYAQAREAAGCIEMGQARHKVRKLENQAGPVRFVSRTQTDDAFQALLDWKSRQYVRTKVTNLFAFPWIVEFLDKIRHAQCGDFSGTFSALYVGDKIAAVHLGMRCRHVMHAWFPAYDPELAKYSPGTIQFVEMIRAAADMGVQRIDLEKGMKAYKLGLMSGAVPVADGSIECSSLGRALAYGRRHIRHFSTLPLLGSPLRLAARITRSLRRRALYQ